MRRSLRRWSLAFLLPGTALYLLVVIVPSVNVVNDSFFDWSAGQSPAYTGLRNFTQLFADPLFLSALAHTFTLMGGALVIQVPLGFVFALLIYRRYAGSGFFQAIYFIPVILSTVVIGVLWTQVYQAPYGLLDTTLRALHLGGLQHAWIGETGTALWSVIVVVGWQYVGLYMLIFLAAMQALPPSVLEAGELDGITGWRQVRHLIVPMLFESVKLSVILVVTGSVQYFNLIWTMTQGGPANASNVLASYMYTRAFQDNLLGYGAAIATVMLVMNLVLAIGLQRLFHRPALELG